MDKVALASRIGNHLTDAWIAVNNGVVDASREGDQDTAESLRDLRRQIAKGATSISLAALEGDTNK